MWSYGAVFLILLAPLFYALEYCVFEENKNRFARNALWRRRSFSLYDQNDKVLDLMSDNFDQTVLNSNRSHVVQFYLNYCGHCQRFAPTYKQFAEYVQPWDDIVRVVAIDCARKPNERICFRNYVRGTPHVKFYPANLTDYSGSRTMRLRSRTFEELLKFTSEFIASEFDINDFSFS